MEERRAPSAILFRDDTVGLFGTVDVATVFTTIRDTNRRVFGLDLGSVARCSIAIVADVAVPILASVYVFNLFGSRLWKISECRVAKWDGLSVVLVR